MNKTQKIILAILRTIFFFGTGLCIGQFIQKEYLISAIIGIITIIIMLIYISYWDYLMSTFKEKYELYKEIVNKIYN